ncbi:ubiquitin-conjugating enzyme E2-22 kDa-like [Drosophila obscura]|uniref:ubiquitin-conjugating enzyme E2-22 kDa-like n=1 Tax=Drosophila obscura TaxID=7282 RepID=UPI001BB0F09C|nr:ubiquitin-conjugating enzyme E2-22 kDa-like [Drosophila obscura]
MVNLAVSRIKQEFKEVMRSEEIEQCPIKIELVNDSWTNLRGQIAGSLGTPYEGGKFLLEINVPETYPFTPSKVRFITRIWHPNLCADTGAICLDILKQNLSAAMTLRTVCLSVQALLAAAEPDDPLAKEVAHQFKEHYDMFRLTAKHWTNAYAGGPLNIPDCDASIQRLRDMGVDEHEARRVLSVENWNLKNATESAC